MRQICIGEKHHKTLQAEFRDVSRQTIYAALKYFNNSAKAKQIRKRAIELLQEEHIEALKIEPNILDPKQ